MSRFVLTAQLQLQAPNNVRQVVQQIQSQLNGVNVNVQVQNSVQAQRQLQQVTQATNQATTAAERMGKAFSLSVRRFAAFSVATRAVSLFTNTLGNAVQDAIDFERQLIKVGQVTGKTVGQLRGLTKQITSLSTGFGVASSDLLEVSTVLAQAGLTAEDTAVALRTLAKAALAPNFDSITETAEGAIAILAQFQQGVGALEAQLGSINAVAGAFAVEASDLIDVIRRTGGVFKASGGSLNELLALFTSVRATTRESAESIGTGLRTIFTRIQRPKTIEFLKQFGVELVDLNGKFVGPYEAIKRLSEALSGLGEGDLTFISIAEELGGFRQIGKVLPLLQQFSTAQSALNVAMKAGDSLTQDAASAQAALAIRIMKVKEEFLALIRSLTETSTFQIMANTALSLASALIKIADSIKPLLPMLAALAAFRMVKGMGSFFGGMMSGATSGRTYNKGGKVLGFARGGLVPGSGNGDTVPAMLAPGEFVIRKSSVNKMGAGTLAAMNENRYATGGIVVDPSKIGAFFLRPEKGADRNPIKISGDGSIKNPAALAQLGMSPKASEARKQAIDNMSVDRQAKLFGFTRTRSTRKINSDSLFDSRGNLLQSTSKAKELFRNANYSVEDTRNLDINKIQSKLDRGIAKGKLSIGSQSVPMSGFISGYFPGMDDLQNSNVAKIIADNTRKGLYNTILKSVDPIINSLNNPAISINTSQARSGAKRIANDPNAQATTQGFAFEGLIQSITGAKLAGNQANFDFPNVKSASSSLKNMFTDSTGEGLDSLIKADAKRSNTTDAIDSIKNKIANDINRGKFEGVNFVKKFFGGIIQKFANGGMASAPLVDDILSNASGSLLPRPSSAIASLIKAGGGAIDIDRTLKRTIGDKAYANAKTGAAKDAVLSKYFRDDSARLNDIKSAPLTAFGKELQGAIKSGQLNPGKLSIISKSSRTRGVPEYLSQLFGIPIGNMIFTGGGSKQPAMDALRSKGPRSSRVARFATGGSVGTDTVPALLTPGEFVVNRSSAQRIGYGNLNRMNKVGKYAKGGVVQHFATGTSGTGAKPSAFQASSLIESLGGRIPGLINSLETFSSSAGLSGKRQEELAVTLEFVIRQMRSSAATIPEIIQNVEKFKTKLDTKTQELDQKRAALNAEIEATPVKATTKGKKEFAREAFDKAKLDAGIGFMSVSEEASKTGKSKAEIAAARKATLQEAGFTKGSKRSKDLLGPDTPAPLTPEEQKKARTDEVLRTAGKSGFSGAMAQAKAGKFNVSNFGAVNFDKLTSAQRSQIFALQKASQATNTQASASHKAATASQKAAAADAAEANASNKAATADNIQSKGGGMGMGGGKMMAASMATGLLSSFLPAVDESSSAMLKMTHNLLGLVTTITTVGFALEAFGLTLNKQTIGNVAGGIGNLFGKGGLGALASKVSGTAAAGGVVKGGLGGMASTGAFKAGLSANTAANIGGAVRVFTSALTKVAVPIAAAAGTFLAFKKGGDFFVDSILGYAKKVKDAIDAGDASKAGKVAYEQASAKNNVTVGAGVAGGAVGGALIGSAIVPVIGTAVGAVVGAALGGLSAYVATDLPSYASALAASQAAQIDIQNKLNKATEESTKALEEYKNGTKSGTEVVKTFAAAAESVATSRMYLTTLMNKAGSPKGPGNVGSIFGAVSKEKEIIAATKNQQKQETKVFQASMPALNALGRDVALAGGSFDDFLNNLRESNRALYDIVITQDTNELRKNFANISTEVAKAKKVFEALNLGLRAPVATATAASSALSNFTANLEVGSNPVTQSVATLEAAFSEAGQAMDPKTVGSAIDSVASTLEEFGASDAFITKFKENAAAFAAVSANYNEIFKGVKEDFTEADFKGLNADQFKDKFASNLDEQLKNAGIGDETRKRMGEIVGGIKLDDEDLKKLRGGDLSVFQKYLDQAGQKTLEEAKKIAEETAKVNQQLIGLTKQRIEAERNLVQAQQEAIDLFMEGREIQGKYGGRAVTTQERRGALLQRSNVEATRLGLSAMRTGDVGELRRRNAEIRGRFSGIESQRTSEGGMQGVGGVEADATQQNLQKAYKTQIETIRGLIKLEEEQLKITEEKNKLERDSMESLVKGDVEAFFKQQAAVGATAAIASGDQRLMNQYGAEALGTAALDIKRQQEAGVQTLYGQQLAGAGGLTEAAAGAALASRGVTDMRAAQVMAGTTAEEEASKARLRELGGMLGETGALGAEMAEMQVQTATVNINTANLKLEEIKERGRKVAAEAERIEGSPAVAKARGGLIYANRGIFVPRGTDTVPAMLTPGEFVVNRGAVQRGNNLQILQAMNGGAGVSNSDGGAAMMARGGMVRYRQDGSSGPEAPSQGMTNFVTALENFNRVLSENVQSLRDTKISIKLDSTSVSINLNDGGLLKALTGQVKQEIFGLIENQFKVVDGGRLKRTDGGIVS